MRRIAIAILILVATGVAYAANELQINYPTGVTVIATVTNDAGQWFDTASDAFETYNTLTDYDIAMTDQGNGEYRGTMDTGLPAGTYTVHFHANSNVVPFGHHYNFYWSGTAKIDYLARIGDPNSGDTLAGDLVVVEGMVDALEGRLSQTLTFSNVGGVQMPQVSIEAWNATAVPSEHTAGYPIVTVKDGTGTGEINTDGGKVVEVSTLTGHTAQTGDAYAVVNHITYGNAAIENLVDDIGTAGAGLTAVGDTRMANLDAAVSSRSSHSAADVVTALGTGSTLTALGTASNQTTIIGYVDGVESTLGVAGAGLTALPWNAAWDAEVQSEATDALNAYDPPTYAEMVARTIATVDYLTLATVVDGTKTIDDVFESWVAVLIGKSTIVDLGSTNTVTYYKQDGTTVQLQNTVLESNGTRTATGTMN